MRSLPRIVLSPPVGPSVLQNVSASVAEAVLLVENVIWYPVLKWLGADTESILSSMNKSFMKPTAHTLDPKNNLAEMSLNC